MPEATAKANAKAKAEEKVSSRSKELLQRIKGLTREYESGLTVVDTFTHQKLAVVPMRTREWDTIRPSREAAIKRLCGKPGSIYSDAEAALTRKKAD